MHPIDAFIGGVLKEMAIAAILMRPPSLPSPEMDADAGS